MSGIRFTKLDIVLDAIRKEKNILKDHADIREQAIQLIFPYVSAAQFNAPFIYIPKTSNQAAQCRFTRARWTDYRRSGFGRDRQIDMVQNLVIAIRKANILQFNHGIFRSNIFAGQIHYWCIVNSVHLVDGAFY